MKKLFITILLVLIFSAVAAWGSGETEENLPPYDPSLEGWQALSYQEGIQFATPSPSRQFQMIYKNALQAEPNALRTYLQDFFGSTLALYASDGVGFSTRHNGSIVLFSGDESVSFTRIILDRQVPVLEDHFVSFTVKNRETPLPILPPTSKTRYTFRGYLTLSLSDIPGKPTQIEPVMMQAIQKLRLMLAQDDRKTTGSGRVWLIEHRYVGFRDGQIGIYCKIIVEFE